MFSPVAFWGEILSSVFSISGGITSSYTSGADTFMVHTFNSSTTMTVTGNGTIDYLLIGGGGGGSNGGNFGVGGGAGEHLESSININEGTYTINIGGGGAAQTNGSISEIVGVISATAGYRGDGVGYDVNPTVAGYPKPLSGKSGQGFLGGTGSNSVGPVGGGGGAGAGRGGFNHNSGAANTSPSALGGWGLTSSINGTATIRAGGGGGAQINSPSYNNGGAGGGGRGGWNVSGQQFGRPATANTGSGGGGAVNNTAGAGGSGLLIIRYKIN